MNAATKRDYVRCPECHTVINLTPEQKEEGVIICPGIFPNNELCNAEIDLQEAWEEMESDGV
jgi:hypothetical protein